MERSPVDANNAIFTPKLTMALMIWGVCQKVQVQT
jgi:hypothetical protein